MTNQLIGSIVQLAHGARLKVVGVGVEDEETAKILVHAGCDELQGYLLGRPLPSERLVHVEAQTAAVMVTA